MLYANNILSVRIFTNLVAIAVFALIATPCCPAQVDLTKLKLSAKKTYLLKTTQGKRYAGRVDEYDKTGLVMTRRNGRIAILKPSEIESIE